MNRAWEGDAGLDMFSLSSSPIHGQSVLVHIHDLCRENRVIRGDGGAISCGIAEKSQDYGRVLLIENLAKTVRVRSNRVLQV